MNPAVKAILDSLDPAVREATVSAFIIATMQGAHTDRPLLLEEVMAVAFVEGRGQKLDHAAFHALIAIWNAEDPTP